MTCNLCDYRTIVNEARERGDETWLLADQGSYGVSLFVIPKGATPDLRVRRDDTYGPQRKVWFDAIQSSCACGEDVALAHPPSTWKPDDTQMNPEPVEEDPVSRPLREQGEISVPLNLL